eukprot:8920198-Alexandrium_andersonii.AAC.1
MPCPRGRAQTGRWYASPGRSGRRTRGALAKAKGPVGTHSVPVRAARGSHDTCAMHTESRAQRAAAA